jgi:hypothetical protein
MYTEGGIPQLFYCISKMFQTSWTIIKESDIKWQVEGQKIHKYDNVTMIYTFTEDKIIKSMIKDTLFVLTWT